MGITMAAAHKRSVTFNAAVSYGFKHDTPGHEATVDANDKKVTATREFVAGDSFEVPQNENDEFDKLAALGLITEG
jgi:hypothetical protein